MKKTALNKHFSSMIAVLALLTLPAQTVLAEGQTGGGDGFASLIPLILIMVIFWVLLIRPQQKRMKAHAEVIKSIKKGDKVITGGGILGRVSHVKDGIATVEVAEGVSIKVKQDSIGGLQESPQPQDKKDK